MRMSVCYDWASTKSSTWIFAISQPLQTPSLIFRHFWAVKSRSCCAVGENMFGCFWEILARWMTGLARGAPKSRSSSPRCHRPQPPSPPPLPLHLSSPPALPPPPPPTSQASISSSSPFHFYHMTNPSHLQQWSFLQTPQILIHESTTLTAWSMTH